MPPVDIFDLAYNLDVQVFMIAEQSWSGFLDTRAGPARVWLKQEDSIVRQRFTLAHELGHLMLHPSNSMAFRDTIFSGADFKEAQANGYAVGLLMPLFMLAQIAPHFGYDVDRLAAIFGVSSAAMEIRLLNLHGVGGHGRG